MSTEVEEEEASRSKGNASPSSSPSVPPPPPPADAERVTPCGGVLKSVLRKGAEGAERPPLHSRCLGKKKKKRKRSSFFFSFRRFFLVFSLPSPSSLSLSLSHRDPDNPNQHTNNQFTTRDSSEALERSLSSPPRKEGARESRRGSSPGEVRAVFFFLPLFFLLAVFFFPFSNFNNKIQPFPSSPHEQMPPCGPRGSTWPFWP